MPDRAEKAAARRQYREAVAKEAQEERERTEEKKVRHIVAAKVLYDIAEALRVKKRKKRS